MTSLSFGALRKAQRTLDRMDGESDSADESDGSLSTDHESKSESQKRVKESNRASATPARKNKHACVSPYRSSQDCLNRRHQADRGHLQASSFTSQDSGGGSKNGEHNFSFCLHVQS